MLGPHVEAKLPAEPADANCLEAGERRLEPDPHEPHRSEALGRRSDGSEATHVALFERLRPVVLEHDIAGVRHGPLHPTSAGVSRVLRKFEDIQPRVRKACRQERPRHLTGLGTIVALVRLTYLPDERFRRWIDLHS
jgi:hypothetical protein